MAVCSGVPLALESFLRRKARSVGTLTLELATCQCRTRESCSVTESRVSQSKPAWIVDITSRKGLRLHALRRSLSSGNAV